MLDFVLFCKIHINAIIHISSQLQGTFIEVSRQVYTRWKEMSDADKAAYNDRAAALLQ